MRPLIILLLVLACCLYKPYPDAKKHPFLAVFGTIGAWDWDYDIPDYAVHHPANGWSDFPKFLVDVKQMAGSRPIVLDMSCHGNWSYTVTDEQDRPDFQDARWVIENIDRHLGDTDLTVLFESCYGRGVYMDTMGSQRIPRFPIYGNSERHVGWNNAIWQQYKHNFRLFFTDFRDLKPVMPRLPHANERQQMLRTVWLIMYGWWAQGGAAPKYEVNQ